MAEGYRSGPPGAGEWAAPVYKPVSPESATAPGYTFSDGGEQAPSAIEKFRRNLQEDLAITAKLLGEKPEIATQFMHSLREVLSAHESEADESGQKRITAEEYIRLLEETLQRTTDRLPDAEKGKFRLSVKI